MNKQEAAKLLSLIKLSYPASYRDLDKTSANATVNMWQLSFSDVPYAIMEQAFNHFRMISKFPPTVADMVEELRHLYYQALEGESIQNLLKNEEGVRVFQAVMHHTARYIDNTHLGALNIASLQGSLNGSIDYAELPQLTEKTEEIIGG